MFVSWKNNTNNIIFPFITDKEPPYNTYCPEDIKKTYVAENEQGMLVSWPKPAEFKDNSGKDPTFLSIPPSSSYFGKGVHQVR